MDNIHISVQYLKELRTNPYKWWILGSGGISLILSYKLGRWAWRWLTEDPTKLVLREWIRFDLYPVFRRRLPVYKQDLPFILAHRGCGGNLIVPENTMTAFTWALQLPYVKGIETDLHRTKDGVLVLMHDAHVERTTLGTGCLWDMTYDEVTRLRPRFPNCSACRSSPDSPACTCHVPTFKSFLELIKPTSLAVFLDIKQLGIMDDVWAMICAFGLQDRVLCGSVTPKINEEVTEFLKVIHTSSNERPEVIHSRVPMAVHALEVLYDSLKSKVGLLSWFSSPKAVFGSVYSVWNRRLSEQVHKREQVMTLIILGSEIAHYEEVMKETQGYVEILCVDRPDLLASFYKDDPSSPLHYSY